MTPQEVKNARARLNMTQPQLADALGVSTIAVRQWEQAQRPVTPTRADQITALLAGPYVALAAVSRALNDAATWATTAATTARMAGWPEGYARDLDDVATTARELARVALRVPGE